MADAWGLWNVKGKFYAQSFLEGFPFQLVLDHIEHPGYPLAIPISLAYFATLNGGWSFFIPILYNYFSFLFYFYLIYCYSKNQDLSFKLFPNFLIFSALFSPGMLLISTDQCADFPIGCNLAFLFFLIFEMKSKQIKPMKGFFFVGLSMSVILNIKMEGFVIVMIFFPFFLIYMKEFINKKTLLLLTVGLTIPLIMYIVYKVQAPELNPVPITFDHVIKSLLNITRYINVLKYFSILHASVFFLVFVTIGFFIREKVNQWLFLPLGVMHVAYSSMFLITSEEQIWHLETAYTRIHLQLIPAFCLIAIYLISQKYISNEKSF